jgi:eukaryotic-like serine/threonine-protein kinase
MSPRRERSSAMEQSASQHEEAPPISRVRTRPLRDGPYVWGEPVGAGGMAHVHLARRVNGDGEVLAAKRILPAHRNNSRFLRMFMDEARISANLDHPNIVKTIDFGEQDGELVMVMEFVDGLTCSEMLESTDGETAVPLSAALFVATEVLSALEYAHGAHGAHGNPLGIVHRDISPGNILVGSSGEVKLADFGVARSTECPRDTRPGALKGNVGYMSPEQVVGDALDRRSDVFSLGVVLYEMLTGKPIFHGTSEFEILARTREANIDALADPTIGIPLELRLILATALARDPRERFATAAEFSDALHSFARHVNVSLEPSAMRTWVDCLRANETYFD